MDQTPVKYTLSQVSRRGQYLIGPLLLLLHINHLPECVHLSLKRVFISSRITVCYTCYTGPFDLSWTSCTCRKTKRPSRPGQALGEYVVQPFSPVKTSWLIKNRPVWATGSDNGASVHSAVYEYLAIDRDGNFT